MSDANEAETWLDGVHTVSRSLLDVVGELDYLSYCLGVAGNENLAKRLKMLTGQLLADKELLNDSIPGVTTPNPKLPQEAQMSTSYKPVFKMPGDEKWYDNAQRFATRDEALESARARFMSWTAPEKYDVHESDDPVNYRRVEGADEWIESGGRK